MLKRNCPWRTLLICHSLLTLSQSNLGHPKHPKNGGWGRPEQSPDADAPGGPRVLLVGWCCRVCVPPGSGGLFVAAVVKVVSDSCQWLLDTTTAAAPLWAQQDQSGSCGLKQAPLCSGSQRAFPGTMVISCPACHYVRISSDLCIRQGTGPLAHQSPVFPVR